MTNWNFNNSFAQLPEQLFSHVHPVAVKAPKKILLNSTLAKELDLDFSALSEEEIAALFSGNILPLGTEAIAQAYAGHQYGNFAMLGDGRAIVLGEHLTKNGQRVDIQLKGSGPTPYSRQGDGRAALGPMLREYLISEAMHALNIPTTRSLAVTATGEEVRRATLLPGAILTRVATSHIRVATFEYVATLNDANVLKRLTEHTIARHYPEIKDADNSSLELLKAVMQRQITLITHWMRVGFIHGVMNTDNMAISGETIDYGPCAFMNAYDPTTVFSSIDHYGRYAFGNQPKIAQWNLARFAETLLPLLHEEPKKALQLASDVINNFPLLYGKAWMAMMREKIGLFGEEKEDEILVHELLALMQTNQADYTNTFRELMKEVLPENKLFQEKDFLNWHLRWKARLSHSNESWVASVEMMRRNNPAIIPRNHKVEEVLEEASVNENLVPLENFLEVFSTPYDDNQSCVAAYQNPPVDGDEHYQTFCGT
jgi:uncharacterized protein YdiU (UPF0061 family)